MSNTHAEQRKKETPHYSQLLKYKVHHLKNNKQVSDQPVAIAKHVSPMSLLSIDAGETRASATQPTNHQCS